MNKSERVIVYALLALAIGLGLASQGTLGGNRAFAEPMTSAGGDASKVAVCDVYGIAEKVIQSDRYIPARQAEEDRLKKEIEPLENELKELQREIQALASSGADPKDEHSQAKVKEFQQKREAYAIAREKGAISLQQLISTQFIEAFGLVREAAAKVASDKGFSHVFASRDARKPIESSPPPTPERLIEAFLGRPVIVAPESADITADVIDELKL